MINSGGRANFDVDMVRARLQIFSKASAEWNVFFELEQNVLGCRKSK